MLKACAGDRRGLCVADLRRDTAICRTFAGLFGAPRAATEQVLEVHTQLHTRRLAVAGPGGLILVRRGLLHPVLRSFIADRNGCRGSCRTSRGSARAGGLISD